MNVMNVFVLLLAPRVYAYLLLPSASFHDPYACAQLQLLLQQQPLLYAQYPFVFAPLRVVSVPLLP